MGMKVNGTTGLTFPDATTLESAGQSSVRAWVNFNGTGTVAIRASYNVASITDNGTGNYNVNFTTAMPDANYAVTGMSRNSAGGDGAVRGTSQITTAFDIVVLNQAGNALLDSSTVCAAIFR